MMDEKIHVMVDLETLDVSKEATILTIGAKVFILNGNKLTGYKDFYVRVDSSLVKDYFSINLDTVNWWMQQSETARKEAFLEPKIPLQQVLKNFNGWIQSIKPHYFWAHGKEFDFPILEHAYNVVDLPIPWKYWQLMDTRTLFTIANLDYNSFSLSTKEEGDVKHNSLKDCERQIKAVVRSYEIIKNESFKKS